MFRQRGRQLERKRREPRGRSEKEPVRRLRRRAPRHRDERRLAQRAQLRILERVGAVPEDAERGGHGCARVTRGGGPTGERRDSTALTRRRPQRD